MTGRLAALLSLILFPGAMTGCSAINALERIKISDFSETEYVQNTFLADSLRLGGLAVLPVITDGDGGGTNLLADALKDDLKERLPGTKILDGQECYALLQDSDLDSTHRAALETYARAPIVNVDLVRRIIDEEDLEDFFKEPGEPSDAPRTFIHLFSFWDAAAQDKKLKKEIGEKVIAERINAYKERLVQSVPADKDLLHEIGDLSQVRYLLQIDANQFRDSYTGVDAVLDVTADIFFSDAETADDRLFHAGFFALCRVWDCLAQETVWGGFASTSSSGTKEEYSGAVMGHAEVAAKGLTKLMPGAIQ